MNRPDSKIPILILLISLLGLVLTSCAPRDYLVVPVDPVRRFNDIVPFEATVERTEVGQKPNTGVMIYLKTSVGERRVLVGSTSSEEMIGFAQSLRNGESHSFPAAFFEYQKRRSGKR